MHSTVTELNRRLGERLGYRGANPRFAWQYAPDLFYLWRESYLTNFERHSWAERLGRAWVLCEWRRPEVSHEQWWNSFHGEFPYPDKGMYYTFSETALPQGALPTADLTAFYIHSLAEQMGKTYGRILSECNADAQRDRDTEDTRWDEYVADMEPAFDNWNSGTKSGVEFQVPGLRADRPAVTL